MTRSLALEWWRDSASSLGIKMMDKLISPDAGWEELLRTGQEDVALALQATGMKTSPDRTVLDLGCGMGRLSFALSKHFGRVVGMDVSPALIAEAKKHNRSPNVEFEVGDGAHLTPQSLSQFDSVFSYAVLYLLPPEIVRSNLQDAFRLLKPGGELVFEINVAPFRLSTRLSMAFRSLLYRCGIEEWNGWPNAPGFRRYPHRLNELVAMVNDLGFRIDRVLSQNPKQTWFVATKPE